MWTSLFRKRVGYGNKLVLGMGYLWEQIGYENKQVVGRIIELDRVICGMSWLGTLVARRVACGNELVVGRVGCGIELADRKSDLRELVRCGASGI